MNRGSRLVFFISPGTKAMSKPVCVALRAMFKNRIQFASTKMHVSNWSIVAFPHSVPNRGRNAAGRVILLCGEPDSMRGKKHTILIDCKKTNIPRSIYFPFCAWSFGERRMHTPTDLLQTDIFPKTQFCAFMYNRPSTMRDLFFDRLTQKKKVCALGKIRHNVGTPSDRSRYDRHKTFYDTAVEKYKPFRFVICMENSRHKGYVTEKIVNAMLAGAIPIYWGAPDIGEIFNLESMIVVNDRSQIVAQINKIMRLESDPCAYDRMLRQPWFRRNALPAIFRDSYLSGKLQHYRKLLIRSDKLS